MRALSGVASIAAFAAVVILARADRIDNAKRRKSEMTMQHDAKVPARYGNTKIGIHSKGDSYIREETESPMFDGSELPTELLIEDASELPTGVLIEEESEFPTSLLKVEESESSERIPFNDPESPTDPLFNDESEQPTGSLFGEKDETKISGVVQHDEPSFRFILRRNEIVVHTDEIIG